MTRFRTRELGRFEPRIRINRRLVPRWVRLFSAVITLAWLFYGIYVRIIEPALGNHPTRFERYVEREFPELDVFGPDNSDRPTIDEYRSQQVIDFYRDKPER